MPGDALAHWIVSCLLLGLRIAPIFAFAPPFTLVRLPTVFRLLFGLGLSICLVAAFPATSMLADYSYSGIVAAAFRELILGVMLVLTFQVVFAALYVAGRTIDIQAGYGLALLIDPTSRTQTPLVGTLFAYAAAAIFFSLDGHIELLRLLGASLDVVPIGAWEMPDSIGRLSAFMGGAFLIAFGVAGAAVLVLFLVDLVIAVMSRTIPQMNVLVVGLQVKSIVLLLVLPICFGAGGALLVRMMAMIVREIPRVF